ncbi:hypothetical protein DFR55_11824 [Herbinix hemicellulosilytica]|uniref:Uncharacterized protein n=1 Tax=Herbinix hemicellulosilytica TaxID=1564487 RepID=A0A0H5SSS1_HERHM|nr:hypothetical protein DFR55_11824 [Herbinix hemicellulosilytica]CRZ33348.1 hypothetical protein HHT355_0134 [Herbinix hemicellulosilytica]
METLMLYKIKEILLYEKNIYVILYKNNYVYLDYFK